MIVNFYELIKNTAFLNKYFKKRVESVSNNVINLEKIMSAPNHPFPVLNPSLNLLFYRSVNELDINAWNEVVDEAHFYARTSYLSVIEETLMDAVKPIYVLAYLGDVPVAAIYFQEIQFKFGNVLNNFKSDQNGLKQTFTRWLFRAIKNKKVPLVQSGNLFFTGDCGFYFREGLSLDQRETVVKACMSAENWEKLVPGCSKAFMIGNVFNDSMHSDLENGGFHAFDTEPDLWMTIAPQWKNMGDYLSDLSSKYRVRANKVFSKTESVVISEMSSEEITLNENLLLKLYQQVADNADFNMGYLQKGYFVKMKELFGNTFHVLKYELEDKIVGFSSTFCINGIFHVHFIGIDYSINKNIPLYNRMLFESVKNAINGGCKEMHFGRTATEIKTTIGAVPKKMQNHLKFNFSLFNCMLPGLLRNFGTMPYVVRQPFKNPSPLLNN
jgi:hypothetical protein